MGKVLTVIIPTYNMELYLDRCLSSLIVPNIEMLEVLVINDGSKDKSSEIAHKYEEMYPTTFKVFDKANGNYGSCVNVGLSNATGKYCRILDADDYYSTDNLSLYLLYLMNVDSDVIFTSFTTRDCNNGIVSVTESSRELLDKEYDLYNFDFKSQRLVDLLRMHSICVKTNILRSNKFVQTEGISYTDTQFVFYSILYSKSIKFCPYNIYQYCLGRDGQTMSVSSMLKNNEHFYINAKRLLLDYRQYVELNNYSAKIESLKCCINYELLCYRDIVLAYLKYNKEELKLFQELVEIGLNSKIPYHVEKEIPSKRLFLWLKFRINPKFLNYFLK